jgi:hypothetical protein
MNTVTFGNSKAAIELANILSQKNCKKTTQKVSKFLHSYNLGIREIKKIKDNYWCRRLLTLWREDRSNCLKEMQIDSEIKRFTFGVVTTKYRKAIREI